MGWQDAPVADGWQAAPLIDEPPKQRSAWDEAKRQTGLVGRYVAEGVAGFPLAAMDAGVALRNLATGSQYDMPSQMFQEGLDAVGLPRPEGPIEKGTGLLWSGVAGAKVMPNPTMGNAPPQAQTAQQAIKANLVKNSQDAGYVVPPSTTNPGIMNSILEGTAGKLKTAQTAAIRNQGVTTGLAKDALGLSRSADLTDDAIRAVREEAYNAYRAVRAAGPLNSDDAFRSEVSSAVSDATKLAGKLPSLSEKTLLQQAKELTEAPDLDADTAIAAIREFRDLADGAYRAGKGGTGKAYKALAKSLEDLIERNLSSAGDDGAQLLADYRKARELIAKSHTVEKAFNSATGEVSARKLGQMVSSGKPLTGPLRTAGDFGRSFQKASADVKESFPDFSPIDLYGSGGIAAMTQDPAYLAIPFVRRAVREGLLTPWAQKYLAAPNGGASMVGDQARRVGAFGLLSARQ